MLGERIKELRKKRGLTQQQLARDLGVSVSAVGMYEQGRREPDNRILSMLCRYFSVSADYMLLGREDEVSMELSEYIGKLKAELLSRPGLMFNGQPMVDEDLLKVAQAIELGARIAAEGSVKR